MKIMKRIKYIMAALFAFVIAVISGQAPLSAFSTAYANNVSYSSALEDLSKDENFKETAYPIVSNDYSLSVITVEEGINSQLFVYVYQPSYSYKSLVASSINISTGLYSQLSFKNYKLSLISQDNVFQKYVVDNLIVSSSSSRGYQITSIFRVFDSTIDKELDKNTANNIDEVAFPVAKQYIFENDGIYVNKSEKDVETITVTQKYCGFIRFLAHPHNIFGNEYDAHFVAFSTDKKIDNLYYADISYISREVHYYWNTSLVGSLDNPPEPDITYGKEIPHDITISSKDKVSIEIGGLGGDTYFFNRIQSVEDFKKTMTLDEEEYNLDISYNEELLDGMKWVLRFTETDFVDKTIAIPVLVYDKYYTKISEVTIMRLYFETDGIFYNLGVIDNKQTGSSQPFAEYRKEEQWQKIVALLLLIVAFIIFWPILSPLLGGFFKLVFTGTGKVLKGGVKVATFPLRFIFDTFKKK